jgi:hypothetical protein
VPSSGVGADGSSPTLKIHATIRIDPSMGFLVMKSIFFGILVPLIPFMQHTFTYEATANYSIMVGGTETQMTVAKSALSITRSMFTKLFPAAEAMPHLAEDLSWKIALDLKRHPDWLRTPSTATTP